VATKIEWMGKTAEWDDEEDKWWSDTKDLERLLNMNHENNKYPAGSNPWPAGIAVEIAKELFPDLKVLETDKKPEFDKDAIY
jgi:hypothetical protein